MSVACKYRLSFFPPHTYHPESIYVRVANHMHIGTSTCMLLPLATKSFPHFRSRILSLAQVLGLGWRMVLDPFYFRLASKAIRLHRYLQSSTATLNTSLVRCHRCYLSHCSIYAKKHVTKLIHRLVAS